MIGKDVMFFDENNQLNCGRVWDKVEINLPEIAGEEGEPGEPIKPKRPAIRGTYYMIEPLANKTLVMVHPQCLVRIALANEKIAFKASLNKPSENLIS